MRKSREERMQITFAILISENEAQMIEILAKEEEEERIARKRKLDQLEVGTRKRPAAPECPVCAWKY